MTFDLATGSCRCDEGHVVWYLLFTLKNSYILSLLEMYTYLERYKYLYVTYIPVSLERPVYIGLLTWKHSVLCACSWQQRDFPALNKIHQLLLLFEICVFSLIAEFIHIHSFLRLYRDMKILCRSHVYYLFLVFTAVSSRSLMFTSLQSADTPYHIIYFLILHSGLKPFMLVL